MLPLEKEREEPCLFSAFTTVPARARERVCEVQGVRRTQTRNNRSVNCNALFNKCKQYEVAQETQANGELSASQRV